MRKELLFMTRTAAIWNTARRRPAWFSVSASTVAFAACFLLPVLFGLLIDLADVRLGTLMLLYGVLWVSPIWMYLTEICRKDVMEMAAAVPHVLSRQTTGSYHAGTSS